MKPKNKGRLILSRLTTYSDYKDDGTNILLDANENAYGPALDVNEHDRRALEIDLLGLNRYPDP